MIDEQTIIEERYQTMDKFKTALMESNIPDITRYLGEAEVITTYLNDNVNAIKVKMEELTQQKAQLQIELIKYNSELQNWKSLKSSAKTIGANTRSIGVVR